MSLLSEEILSYLGHSDYLDDAEYMDDILMHYGMKYRSGRYPYGSGEDPYQHGKDFLGRIDELKKSGFTYVDENEKVWTGDNAIAKSLGLSTTEYRRQVSWANHEEKLRNIETAKRLRDKEGMGATEIGRQMGVSESTVRGWLKDQSEDRMQQTVELVNFLGKQLEEKKMIDVGVGAELDLNVSRTKFDTALDYLVKAEGCNVYAGGIPQLTSKQQTNQLVLCAPGIPPQRLLFDKLCGL